MKSLFSLKARVHSTHTLHNNWLAKAIMLLLLMTMSPAYSSKSGFEERPASAGPESLLPAELASSPEGVMEAMCNISSITVPANSFTAVDNKETTQCDDDTFTANVTVNFTLPPSNGNLVLSLDGNASVPVTSLVGNSHTFVGVEMSADGSPIHLRASFSTLNPPCSLTVPTVGVDAPYLCTCPPGAGGAFPACLAPGTQSSPCASAADYEPDPNYPEHTPIRYVKLVLHFFQREDPLQMGQYTAHPTDPQNFSIDHIDLIKSWFTHPDGLNGSVANLCDDLNDGSDWMKDARVRYLNTGTLDVDVFFHPVNSDWGMHLSAGCTLNGVFYPDSNNPSGTFLQRYIIGPNYEPTLPPSYVAHMSDVENRNAYHVFIPRGLWVDVDDDDIPDDPASGEDCYNFSAGGFMSPSHFCINTPYQTVYGAYQRYVTGAPNPIILGRQLRGESLHLMGMDHTCPFQSHWNHEDGGDGCADTPFDSAPNMLSTDFNNERCALTKCQLGKLHRRFDNAAFPPAFQRFPHFGTNGDIIFTLSTEDNCDRTDPDIIVTAGHIADWKSPRNLRSNVIVKPGATLKIRCEVGMPEDGRIIVEPGGKLYVLGGRIFNNCSDLPWEGITVRGTPNLSQYGSSQQGWLHLSDAVLEGSNIAAMAWDPNVAATGGVIKALRTHFINNGTAVFFGGYQNFNPSTGAPAGNRSDFKLCTFTVNDAFPGAYSEFKRHADLTRVTGIEFEGCKFINEISHGNLLHAEDLGKGISTRDADYIVTRHCDYNPNNPCSSFTRSSFTGFGTAIESFNRAAVNTFRVAYTDFKDNALGIIAERVDNPLIVLNTFEVGTDLDWAPATEEEPFQGIHLYHCTGYKVEENFFETTALPLPTGRPVVGSVMHRSGAEANEVYMNDYSGLDFANLSNGDNRGPNINDGLQYRCNVNSANMFDFAVPDEAADVLNQSGIAENQGSSGQAAGNMFSSSPTQQEGHFLNHTLPITYFFSPGLAPVNRTPPPLISISGGQTNQCVSQIPLTGEGGLSELASEDFEEQFLNEPDPRKRTFAANMLIRDYLVDTTHQDLGAVREWLENKGGLFSRFAIIDSWIQEKEAAEAQASLDDIPSDFSLDNVETREYTYFHALKTIQINAFLNGIDEQQMVMGNEGAIWDIANAGPYYASTQALGLLNDHANNNFMPHVTLPSFGSGGQGLIAPPPGNLAANTFDDRSSLSAMPNPANGSTVFQYRLPKEVTRGKLQIARIDGQVVEELLLDSNQGQTERDIQHLEGGVYICRLQSEGKTVRFYKLIII